jgi:hypothetical protein
MSWLHRVLRFLGHLLRGPQRPTPLPIGELTERRESSTPIPVLAKGYVFDFQILPDFTWTSHGLRRELLNDWVEQLTGRARRDLAHTAADFARRYPPHRARELEVELNRALSQTVWHYERSGVALDCRPRARVRLDAKVKEYLQPFWERQIKLECEHEVGMRRAHLLDERAQRWLSVLERLNRSKLAGSAARLTEQEFAEVVQELVANERETVERLMSLLRDAINNDGQADAGLGRYELAEIFDMLNTALHKQDRAYHVPGTNGRTRQSASGAGQPS